MPFEEQRGIDIGLYADVAGTPTLIGGLRNCELTVNGDTIDASHGGNFGWRSKLAGMIDWAASAGSVILMDVAAGGFDPALQAIRDAQRNRVPLAVEIQYPDGSSDGGDAIVTQFQVSAPYDGVAEGSIQLEGAGQLTNTPPPP